MRRRGSPWLPVLWATFCLAPAAAAQVTIDWVTVGDPGNACDTQPQGCMGTVAAEYRIAKYEVSNAEYAAFLNAVAATDTHALYTPIQGEYHESTPYLSPLINASWVFPL